MENQKPLEIIERKNNDRWKHWSSAEKDIMTKYYEKKGGKGIKKYLPNKSMSQIYDYAAGHKLKAPKANTSNNATASTWTPKELKKLVRLFPNHTYAEIGDAIGRTAGAVKEKAYELGLSKRTKKPLTNTEKLIIKEFYPYEGIAVMKRLSPDRLKNTVQKFIRMNGLTTLQLRDCQVDNVELTVMKKMYIEGYTYASIANVTGYCTRTVKDKIRLIDKMEKLKETSSTTWSESDEQELTVMFESGASVSKCADTLSRTENAVTKNGSDVINDTSIV